MPYLFTSESVSEGHPDKVADQISDALIDNFLAFDPQSEKPGNCQSRRSILPYRMTFGYTFQK